MPFLCSRSMERPGNYSLTRSLAKTPLSMHRNHPQILLRTLAAEAVTAMDLNKAFAQHTRITSANVQSNTVQPNPAAGNPTLASEPPRPQAAVAAGQTRDLGAPRDAPEPDSP